MFFFLKLVIWFKSFDIDNKGFWLMSLIFSDGYEVSKFILRNC